MLRPALLAAILLALPAPPAPAQGSFPGPARRDRGPDVRGIFDLERPGELASFFDGVMGEHLVDHGTPGAVVVVVKGQQILFARGYGDADMEEPRAVDPDSTIFRVGSLSKLLTATAIMQQVEAGTLALDAPVNHLLPDLAFPRTFRRPITLRHLLTHTAGLGMVVPGIAARTDEERLSLEEFCRRHQPRRVLPVETEIRYSNYGYTLLGLVLERVTGLDFESYMNQHVFGPLRMMWSSFRDLPHHERRLAHPYRVRRGVATRLPRYEFNIGPAANLRGSGVDMARFMIAMLNGGELQGRRILTPESVAEMQRLQFSHHPALPGLGLGFFTGPRGVGHAGGSLPSLSSMVLIPSERVGVFVTSNAVQGVRLLRSVTGRFLKRYFPLPPAPPPGPVRDVGRFAGRYRSGFHPTRSPLAMAFLLNPLFPEVVVTAEADGRLAVHHPLTGGPGPLSPTEDPLVFQRDDGHGKVAFQEGPDGEVEAICFQSFFPLRLQRIHAGSGRGLQALLTAGFLLAFLVWGPLAGLRDLAGRLRGGGERRELADHLVTLASTGFLVLLTAPVLAAFPGHGGLPALCFGLPLHTRLALVLGTLNLVPTLVLAGLTLGELRRGPVSRHLKVAVLVAFLVHAGSWGLLGAAAW